MGVVYVMSGEKLAALAKKRRRELILAGLFCVGIILFMGGDDEEFTPIAEEKAVETITAKKPAHREIKFTPGIVRNPFTYAHETRDEAERIEAPAPEAKPQLEPTNTASVVQPSENKVVTAPIEPAPTLNLVGIADGGAEKLALISDGKTTGTLGIGEVFAGAQVMEIGQDYVKLAGENGEVTLRMKGF